MIPLRQTLRVGPTPFVKRWLIAANCVVFALQLLAGASAERIVTIFGFIPARLYDPARFGFAVPEVALTFLTSLFMHGGLVHLLGNMLYLWVFGDAVEDRLGHRRFLLFYLFCGAFGSFSHSVIFPASIIPSIGASGSIAGVLGAFLVLIPRAKVVTLLPLIVSWTIIEVPAALFLPGWILMQFMNGFMTLASARGSEEASGVAWWAHIGGFSVGMAVAYLARRRDRNRPPPEGATP